MPGLYGISNSNRDFSNADCWGKNQFNSSFPVSLACYMRDKGIPAVYMGLNNDCTVIKSEISFDNVFGTNLNNDELYFSFESKYEPYSQYLIDNLETIDLVVKEKESGNYLRPIEVKLTTLPDSTTAKLQEAAYGSEIVVRSPTMRYMALSFADSCKDNFDDVREIIEPSCQHINQWENQYEINHYLEGILEALETFFSSFRHLEKPLLMQPIWKTHSQSPVLTDYCLDIFMWSDFALSRLFMDSAKIKGDRITRPQRSAVRLARFLYEISKNGKVLQAPIYDGMTFNTLNDKEFSTPGSRTNEYMKCDRLTKPIIHQSEIKNIILGGGQKCLSPERRFDAILYFSTDLFE